MDLLRDRDRFRPHEKLHTSRDYQRVKEKGRRRRTPHFGVNYAPNGLPHHRLGLIILKRFWNAVGRNRIKRRLREWFRLNKDHVPSPGLDIVIVARPGAEHLSIVDISGELLPVLTGGNGCN